MKLTIVIDNAREEEIIVYAHNENDITRKIRLLAEGESAELLGYKGDAIFPLDAESITCFISDGNNVYALIDGERFKVRQRLYQLCDMLNGFIKINQSCLANISQIDHFESTPFGALTIVFKGGYKDYVSRRNLKTIKERFGI